jgi:hypothetical protein
MPIVIFPIIAIAVILSLSAFVNAYASNGGAADAAFNAILNILKSKFRCEAGCPVRDDNSGCGGGGHNEAEVIHITKSAR